MQIKFFKELCKVAPYAGAWIETLTDRLSAGRELVAPYAGAWIETSNVGADSSRYEWSLPTRERGLKQAGSFLLVGRYFVAPYAGAWIETLFDIGMKQ